jgi:hypothetical protein
MGIKQRALGYIYFGPLYSLGISHWLLVGNQEPQCFIAGDSFGLLRTFELTDWFRNRNVRYWLEVCS